ncbi:MAG: hypothetical protein M3308_02770 [Actinomycetota bacterium]|nr:hypothetical protein [Actinomycetota bacterium]
MSKTLNDLVDSAVFDTKTKKDKLNLRIRFGERLASGGLPDLVNPDVMAKAWR